MISSRMCPSVSIQLSLTSCSRRVTRSTTSSGRTTRPPAAACRLAASSKERGGQPPLRSVISSVSRRTLPIAVTPPSYHPWMPHHAIDVYAASGSDSSSTPSASACAASSARAVSLPMHEKPLKNLGSSGITKKTSW